MEMLILSNTYLLSFVGANKSANNEVRTAYNAACKYYFDDTEQVKADVNAKQNKKKTFKDLLK